MDLLPGTQMSAHSGVPAPGSRRRPATCCIPGCATRGQSAPHTQIRSPGPMMTQRQDCLAMQSNISLPARPGSLHTPNPPSELRECPAEEWKLCTQRRHSTRMASSRRSRAHFRATEKSSRPESFPSEPYPRARPATGSHPTRHASDLCQDLARH